MLDTCWMWRWASKNAITCAPLAFESGVFPPVAAAASVNPTNSSPVTGAVKRLKRSDIPTPSL